MSKKNALIFVDGAIKVVFGNSVKVIPADDVHLGHNKDFYDNLFASHRVLFVEQATEMSRDDFLAGLKMGVEARASGKPVPQPVPQEGRLPASVVAQAPLGQSPSRLPPVTPPEPQRRQPARQEPDAGQFGQWVKSNAKTIIIIDDLLTNEELAPGIKKALSLYPGRATNLGALDQDKVAASTTLRRLIQNGTVSLSDPTEAMLLEAEHDERTQRENDDRLEQYAPIIDGPAREYAANPSYDSHGADMMEISGDAPQEPSPEDSGSMSGLMAMIAEDSGIQAEDGSASPAMEPRRQLAARPKADVDPTSVARGIRKKHDLSE